MEENDYGTIKLEKLNKIIDNYVLMTNKKENIEIPFQYLINSCFPNLYKIFEDKIKDAYTKGFIAGTNK